MPILSICIPCYGRINYVRNTLNSIYVDNSEVPLEDFEVIISDNNPSKSIQKLIEEYKQYPNIKYYYTTCEGFMNSYHVLKYANGNFLKLHNSQSKFKKGSISLIIREIEEKQSTKSLIFYTNGLISQLPNKSITYDSFEDYMYNLSYWSSWSNGFGIWKENLEKIGNIELNKLFPHTSLFLSQSQSQSFTINNYVLFDVQRIPKRGGHNKFQAFTIEYPSLIDRCQKENKISVECKKHILNDILTDFLPSLLFNKYIARIETFDSTGYKENIKVYFPSNAYLKSWLYVPTIPFKLLLRKLRNI